jgi:hypothetical protein
MDYPFVGMAAVPSVVGSRRPTSLALELSATPFRREPALARGGRRPGRAPAPPRPQGARDPLAQPVDGELAIARLAAGVLGDCGHPGPEARPQAALLLVVERLGGVDLEHGLDPRGGDVGVLAAGAGRAARPQPNLRFRNNSRHVLRSRPESLVRGYAADI